MLADGQGREESAGHGAGYKDGSAADKVKSTIISLITSRDHHIVHLGKKWQYMIMRKKRETYAICKVYRMNFSCFVSTYVELTATWIDANAVMAQNRPQYASAKKPPMKGVRYRAPTKLDTMLAALGLLRCILVVKYVTRFRCMQA